MLQAPESSIEEGFVGRGDKRELGFSRSWRSWNQEPANMSGLTEPGSDETLPVMGPLRRPGDVIHLEVHVKALTFLSSICEA